MAIKSKDLANMLGVSTATMSLVLNNKPGISSELRQSLLSRIRDLGYGYMIKNTEDGSEGGQTGKKIAYLIYSGERAEEEGFAFYPPVMEGVEREARRMGYQLMVVHMDRDADASFLRSLREDCEGVVIQADACDAQILAQLEELRLPAVAGACYIPEGGILSVCVNQEQGMQKAVACLKERGHRRIGYVGSKSAPQVIRDRHRYFCLAMQEAGMEYRPEFDIRQGQSLEALWPSWGMQAPTALILENDLQAPGVYRALRSLGKRIPEDVSVIGFDGRAICSMLDPALTTVRVPRRFMGRTLMMMLAQRMELHARGMENVAVKVEVDVELVMMNSVAAPAEA